MGSVLTVVPACDNCVSVDSSPYYLAVYAVAVAGVLLGAAVLIGTRQSAVAPRASGAAAAVCLGIGLPVAAALAHLPVSVQGGICGGALHAAQMRGLPTDAALDPGQAACKTEGQTVLDYAIVIGTVALLGGATLALAARRAPSTAHHDAARGATSG